MRIDQVSAAVAVIQRLIGHCFRFLWEQTYGRTLVSSCTSAPCRPVFWGPEGTYGRNPAGGPFVAGFWGTAVPPQFRYFWSGVRPYPTDAPLLVPLRSSSTAVRQMTLRPWGYGRNSFLAVLGV